MNCYDGSETFASGLEYIQAGLHGTEQQPLGLIGCGELAHDIVDRLSAAQTAGWQARKAVSNAAQQPAAYDAAYFSDLAGHDALLFDGSLQAAQDSASLNDALAETSGQVWNNATRGVAMFEQTCHEDEAARQTTARFGQRRIYRIGELAALNGTEQLATVDWHAARIRQNRADIVAWIQETEPDQQAVWRSDLLKRLVSDYTLAHVKISNALEPERLRQVSLQHEIAVASRLFPGLVSRKESE